MEQIRDRVRGRGPRGWIAWWAVLLLRFGFQAAADPITLEWTANTETNLVGYRLYQGFAPRAYAITNDLPGSETVSVATFLEVPDEVYHFGLTALGPDNLESDFSNEVAYTNGPAADGVLVTRIGARYLGEEDRSHTVFTIEAAESDSVRWYQAQRPSHGVLERSGMEIRYRPHPDFAGPDTFRIFVVVGTNRIWKLDGTNDVANVPDVPVAYETEYLVRAGEPTEITLIAFDADGDELQYRTNSSPEHGTLAGTPPALLYTPNPGFVGTDRFEFVASDGGLESRPAAVVLRVEVANLPPRVAEGAVSLTCGVPTRVDLLGEDPEGGPVAFELIGLPLHGTMTGTPPRLVYAPEPGFSGDDQITYRAYDLEGESALGSVRFHVRAAGSAESGLGYALWSDRRLGLTWPVGPGGRYVIMTQATLGAPVWTPMALVALEPTETNVFWTLDLSEGAPMGWYRLDQIAPGVSAAADSAPTR